MSITKIQRILLVLLGTLGLLTCFIILGSMLLIAMDKEYEIDFANRHNISHELVITEPSKQACDSKHGTFYANESICVLLK